MKSFGLRKFGGIFLLFVVVVFLLTAGAGFDFGVEMLGGGMLLASSQFGRPPENMPEIVEPPIDNESKNSESKNSENENKEEKSKEKSKDDVDVPSFSTPPETVIEVGDGSISSTTLDGDDNQSKGWFMEKIGWTGISIGSVFVLVVGFSVFMTHKSMRRKTK